MKRKTAPVTPVPEIKSELPDEMPVLEPLDPPVKGEKKMKLLSTRIIIAVYVVLILLGVGTGYLLSRSTGVKATSPSTINTGRVVGSTDTMTFKDSAVGVIQKGGFEGEGTHQLIRDGGPSQTAYIISSVVDLDTYVGKKVKVWGQTIAAKKVSWLMDVGKVELQQ